MNGGHMKKNVFLSLMFFLCAGLANAVVPVAPVELKILGPVDNNVHIQFEVEFEMHLILNDLLF